jgi:polysaccharide biosynthesis/export protein
MRATMILVLALALLPAALAAPPDADAPSRTSATVRIELPQGAGSSWALVPGEKRVILDLPRGASFPLDFGEASGGFVHDAAVSTSATGGHHVDLTIAAGYLAKVEMAGTFLVLTFESRFAPTTEALSEDAYRLGIDDKIAVNVHGQKELDSTLVVSHTGNVTVPLVGDVPVVGLSPEQLAARIAELLGRTYLVDPQVDVSVVEYRSQWVMVTGEVATPGKIPLRGGTRLKEVLSEAGGFAEAAGPSIEVNHKVGDSEKYEKEKITRKDFESGMVNPVVRAGDIVDVPRTAYCYVQGEVRLPNRIPIEQGTTLLRALSLVGGLTEWADRKAVTIRYKDGRALKYNLKAVVEGKMDDPVLVGDEVVVVPRRFF